MKISYFTQHFPYIGYVDRKTCAMQYICGGAENVAYNLAINMAKRKHVINVFTTSVNFHNSLEERVNMKIHRYAMHLKIESVKVSFGLFLKPLKHQVDIVHTHCGNIPAPFIALLCAKIKRVPLIVTYHGDKQSNYGSILRKTIVYLFNKVILNKILSYANVIICPSKYFLKESKLLNGRYQDKIVVIPNGVNINKFIVPYSKEECRKKLGLPVDKNIILSLGTLSPIKGLDVLIRALPNVIKSIPNFRVVIAGRGRSKKKLMELSNELDIKNYITFAGFVNENLTPFYYKSADIFVLPSSMREMFPIVLLEAMASCIPIVASKVGGIPDVVRDGENGLLVPPLNDSALAEAIIFLLQNKNIRKKMGNNGMKKVQNYTWVKIAEKTEKVYSDTLVKRLHACGRALAGQLEL